MQEEIFKVVGRDNQPTLAHKPSMPYCEAVIMEIQRLGNIGPFGLPHSTYKQSVKIGNYVIPKGHVVQVHLGGIMKSKSSWGPDADQFKPDRFYDAAHDQLVKDERIIPFSVGKRQCPGETLARAEIFLYLTGLLQNLSFSVQDPENPPSPSNYVSGTTASPCPFKTRVNNVP